MKIVEEDGIQYEVSDNYPNAPYIKQVKQPEPNPSLLVVTDLASSDPDNTVIDLIANEATCKAGTTLTATVELRDQAGAVIPLSDSFRMPVVARDGREFVVLAAFVNGVASIIVPFTASGVWAITEKAINSALSATEEMSFSGFTAYVVV